MNPTGTSASPSTAGSRALPRAGGDCCGSSPAGPHAALDAAAAEVLARAFKALSDPTRVRLLSLISASEGGEACICDMTEVVGLSQPTVSHHMRQLVEAGLVTREQRGRWAYYAVVGEALVDLGQSLAAAPLGSTCT